MFPCCVSVNVLRYFYLVVVKKQEFRLHKLSSGESASNGARTLCQTRMGCRGVLNVLVGVVQSSEHWCDVSFLVCCLAG